MALRARLPADRRFSWIMIISHCRTYDASAGEGYWMPDRPRNFLNGMCFDDIHAPSPEFDEQAEPRAQALAHPCARRSVARGMATPLAPPVRPRAGLRARESDRRTFFLRVSRQQSGLE